jgi:hypothetical protein
MKRFLLTVICSLVIAGCATMGGDFLSGDKVPAMPQIVAAGPPTGNGVAECNFPDDIFGYIDVFASEGNTPTSWRIWTHNGVPFVFFRRYMHPAEGFVEGGVWIDHDKDMIPDAWGKSPEAFMKNYSVTEPCAWFKNYLDGKYK